MVEQILYASLGALAATLLGLLFLPFFWRRAVRLTTSRLVNRLPVSASEIVAAQDRLRAELAVAMRETERKAEKAGLEATRDRVESARARATELGHLAEISDLRAQVSALEGEVAQMRGERDRSGEQASAAATALAQLRTAADQAQKDLQAARQDAAAARSATEQARIEAAEREAEIEGLRSKITMLGLDARAASPSLRTGASPQMPHVDRPLIAAARGATLDAAALAALRKRLDDVADEIVRAADAPRSEARSEEPAKTEPRRFMPQIAASSGAGA